VLATADFLASEGEFDRGLALIATADPSVITPDERELQIAGYYERHGRYDNAEATLQAWAESAETSAAWEALAQFHVRRGSLEAAESAARQAVAADPDSASAEGVLALIDVIRTGNVSPEAADPLAALVQPELQEVFRALLRVEQWRQANPNDTQGLIDQLRQLAEDYPSEFRVWARLVEVASWQGPNDEAVLYANEAADALPNSIAAARLQTNMLINTERFDEARVAARRWRELTQFDPYDPEMTIAFINWRQERPGTLDLVEPWRERIVAEADESPRQLEFLATLLVEDGQVEAAHELLWPYASEEARWADIYMRTAVSIPDEAAAAEWIDRAYPVLADEISERNAVMRKVQAHYELALALNSSTQYEEVVKLVRPQLDEDDLPIEAFLRLAYAEQQLNRPDDAEVAYRRALDLNPRHPEALNNLAFLHLDAGRVTSETGTLAQRAVEAGASYRLPAEVRAELSNTHGKVLLALDRPNEANDAFQEALLLSPSHLGARLGQAEVNLRDDRPIDAERIVAEVEARREAGETFSEEIINQHESLKRQLAER